MKIQTTISEIGIMIEFSDAPKKIDNKNSRGSKKDLIKLLIA